MSNLKYKIILAVLALCVGNFSVVNAGTDDDCDDGNHDGDFICGLIPVPVFFPDFDAHGGRALTQLPAPLPVQKCVKQVAVKQCQVPTKGKQVDDPAVIPTLLPVANAGDATAANDADSDSESSSSSDEDKPFPHERDSTYVDPFNRNVITLDHGSRKNRFLVGDSRIYHVGALIGIAGVDPHSGAQVSLLTKLQHTRARWANRLAYSYADAREMKWGETPKKAKDFDSWEFGDWMRKNGIVGVNTYVGGGWVTVDARVGVLMRGIWSRHIQKIGQNLIRVTFTREKEKGKLARAQLMPSQKTEIKHVDNDEETKVYIFDISREDEAKALEDLLNKNMLPAKDFAEELAEDEKATVLTTRTVERKRKSTTPFQFGMPVMFRCRTSKHNDRSVSSITNHRNDHETVISSKAYLHQDFYRHINLPKRKSNKKWKYFSHTHQSYNRSYAGSVVETGEMGLKGSIAAASRHLHVQIQFSHDNAKVKKVNQYSDRISRKIGVNDFVIDTKYEKDARIGNVVIAYTMKVSNDALEHLIGKNSTVMRSLFIEKADELIDHYFYTLRDPHELNSHDNYRLKQRRIRKIREETHESLMAIENYLLKLNQPKVRASARESALYIAKLARELSTNHFVLHSFILALPPNPTGYGKLEISGERFLAKRFNVDPTGPQGVDTADHGDDNDFIVDWANIDVNEEGNDFF